MTVRAWLDETGSAEVPYWEAFLLLEDEREYERMRLLLGAGL